ncbi:ATP-binding protein, partial [Candidatus Woesearchaeota archaeon]|nr:ATP-binding protein [Candidatus Woesearchaeota archaeon]
VVRDLGIPKDILLGRYVVKGIATYESQGRILEATALSPITVTRPLLQRQYLGISIGQYIIIALIMMLNWSAYLFYKAKQEKKLRYKKVIDYSSLPQPGARSAFVGKIAETGVRAFMDLDRLQTHTLIAGATGSGKTVAAMDIIEEALKKEVAVMIFDPTSQWSGFFRKCNDKKMLKRFKYFEMSVDDAQSFKGELHTITNPREFIDITTYLKPGTIAVFNTSKLRPEDLDIIVASTIEQIFRQNLPGSHRLKTLIVYDEVHRLLPKFGGSGQGLVQLERGAREFRKWGIGLVLISQVLSDFVGEIKANIGTEMQMRTVYEGDLERVKMKYGEEVQQSVVREAVGTGMVVNAEYNHGRPYFVSFRPILHSTFALTPKAVDAYEKYNERIRELRYQLQQLEELKVDVYDLQLELNLAAVKAQQGQFNMADIYMESIEPRILDQWKKIGKKPKKLEVRLIGEKEIQRGIELAERARAEYMQALEKQKVKTAIELETGEKEKEKEKSYVTEPSPARPEEARKREKAAKEKEAEKIKVEKKEGEEKEKVKIAGAETGAKKEGLIKILKNKLKR